MSHARASRSEGAGGRRIGALRVGDRVSKDIVRSIVAGAALFLCVSTAWGRPMDIPRYARLDTLLYRCGKKAQRLQEAEAFKAKPRIERMILSLREGQTSFEKRKLDGLVVVKEVFQRWPVLRNETLPASQTAALEPLTETLRIRYRGYLPDRRMRRERQSVAQVLVSALTHRHLRARQAAIDGLAAIYGTTNGYRADALAHDRRKAQSAWLRFVKR